MILQTSRFLSAFALVSGLLVLVPTSGAQSSMCAAVSNNPLVMGNLCSDPPKAEPIPATIRTTQPSAPSLTLTAQQISEIRLDNPPMVRPGDVFAFEANSGDFILHIYLSNGKMIDAQPLTRGEAENASTGWKKGRARLDYSEAVNQYIVGFKLVPLHQSENSLMLRGVKIYRNGRIMLELEKSQPGSRPKTPEPSMSYPPDPRVMTASVTTTNLFGREPTADFIAPRLPAFSIQPFLMQSSSGDAGDPNHYKYAGQELDAESGLYLMGARHYSPGLGRFMQADPLYIEMHRLTDPQQLNLYAYSRNNPTTFSDPTGLDIALKCQGGQADCDSAKDQFNGRKDGQFKAGLDKNNKLTARVSKADYAKLSKSEKALYNAINNTSNHATINVVGNTGQSEFGTHDSRGVNTVDLGNLSKLDAPSNAGGLNSGDALAHEAMDAYFSLSMGVEAADQAAFGLYPGLRGPTDNQNILNSTGTRVTGSIFSQAITNGSGTERISIQFITPIPAIDLFGKSPAAQNDITHDAGSRTTGVTFEKPKQ